MAKLGIKTIAAVSSSLGTSYVLSGGFHTHQSNCRATRLWFVYFSVPLKDTHAHIPSKRHSASNIGIACVRFANGHQAFASILSLEHRAKREELFQTVTSSFINMKTIGFNANSQNLLALNCPL